MGALVQTQKQGNYSRSSGASKRMGKHSQCVMASRCDGSCFFRGHCVGKGEVECCSLLKFSVTSRVEERSKLMLSSWLELVRWHASAMAHQPVQVGDDGVEGRGGNSNEGVVVGSYQRKAAR
ncbi:hypothetical protein BHM03_00034965 [Ensete ventricosum]|nr:hypothetical protein BHM03_00034965 [Ensete ventricosum]